MAINRPQSALLRRPWRRRLALALGLGTAWLAAAAQEPEDTAEAPAEAANLPDHGVIVEDATAEIPSETHLTRLETQIVFLDLIEEDRFEEALPLAEALVELIEEEFGSPSAELATAMRNLAVLRRNLGLYDESSEMFLDAIEMYREVEGPFSPSTIDPLVTMGANYHATGDYFQALGIFQEARTVNRRAYGLLNPDQIDIVYHIAGTLASMRRYEEAHLQYEDALRLMERVHGENTLEILPYVYRYAEWLVGSFQFEAARNRYLRAMDIIRELDGPESPLLIKPLREIGNSFRVQKLAEGRGISALKRALEVAENQAEPVDLDRARVLRDIGDWYTAFSRVDASGEEYVQAWELLGNVENGEAIREDWFAEPQYVLREFPSSRGLADAADPGVVEGHVRIVFDVDESGRSLNVNVLESEPPGFKDSTMLRAIRRSRFRPRVVDGEIVYAAGLTRNFTFHYEPEE